MNRIEDIKRLTGFETHYIRRLLNDLKDIFESHIKRGDSNAILIEPSGTVIFDQIKQMKESGFSIPQIRKELEKVSQTQEIHESKGGKNHPQTISGLAPAREVIDLLKEQQRELKQEREKKDQAIREKDHTIKEQAQIIAELEGKYKALDSAIKMLPEGKTPEEIRQDWDRGQIKKIEAEKLKTEIAVILTELKTLSAFRFRKRKALLNRLEELTGLKASPDQIL